MLTFHHLKYLNTPKNINGSNTLINTQILLYIVRPIHGIRIYGSLPSERSQFERIQSERIKEMYLLSEYNLSEFQNYFQVLRLPTVH